MSGQTAPVARIPTDAEVQVFHVPQQDVLDGDPEISFAVTHASADRRRALGRFACTAGRFRWTIVGEEVVWLDAGRLTVRWPGGALALHPGDMYVIAPGTVVEYDVVEPIASRWWVASDEPLGFLS